MAQRLRGFVTLCVDATGVLVLAKQRCTVGHFSVLVAEKYPSTTTCTTTAA
jgi:hypothetical protein